MRAAGHLCHPLADEVGGNQGRSQAMVGGAITQLTVAIVTPGIYFSIYIHRRYRSEDDKSLSQADLESSIQGLNEQCQMKIKLALVSIKLNLNIWHAWFNQRHSPNADHLKTSAVTQHLPLWKLNHLMFIRYENILLYKTNVIFLI